MMAAVAIGAYKTMDDCIADWVTPLLGEAEEPIGEEAARFDLLFFRLCRYPKGHARRLGDTGPNRGDVARKMNR